MPQSNISTWLQFATQQMAAESYLDGIDWNNAEQVKTRLRLGNNRPGFPETGFTRFTGTPTQGLQDQAFVDRYQIIDHHANDATGFSATLMKDTATNTYTLSFRSLEYQNQAQGGDWERDGQGGAGGEIAGAGFALGQLVSMERYYQELKADPTKLPPGAILNVTGYSLGGHLATVFTELHSADIQQTIIFNGAGRGLVGGVTPVLTEEIRLRQLIDAMDAKFLEFDPSGALTRSGSAANVQTLPWYQPAVIQVAGQFQTTGTASLPTGGLTGGVTRTDGAFQKITQLFGSSVTGGDVQVVANSGIHGPVQSVLIEGQPLLEGINQGQLQYGNAHSITLLVDSLAVQELFETVDPDLTQADIEGIFQAASAQKADVTVLPGIVPLAEGNTLEQALDALRKVFHNSASGPFQPTNAGRQPGDFGNLAFRNQFYTHLEELRAAVAGQPFSVEPLVQRVQTDSQARVVPRLTAAELQAEAQDPGDRGLAYRYALRALNPFAVVGVDYAGLGHAADGQLALHDPATGVGEMTDQYLADRAAFLLAKLDLTINNQDTPSSLLAATHYRDVASGFEVPSGLLVPSALQREYLFGGTSADGLTGHSAEDHLYGGDGNDTLTAGGGDDYLEGGQGHDTYQYRTGDGHDTIRDLDGTGTVQINGADLLVALHRPGEPTGTWRSDNGSLTFTRTGEDLNIALQGQPAVTLRGFYVSSMPTANPFGLRFVNLPAQGPLPDYADGLDARTQFLRPNPVPTLPALPGFDDQSNHSDELTVPLEYPANNIVHAQGGHDTVFSAGGNDQLYGEEGNDLLFGKLGHDQLFGGDGVDTLIGDDSADPNRGGHDLLDGGPDSDVLQGNAGNDTVLGGPGNDNVNGDDPLAENLGTNNDWLEGGEGDDSLFGAAGGDVLLGGPGQDLLIGDTTQFVGGLTGNGGADVLDGGEGDDQLFALYGDDILVGDFSNDPVGGDDVLDGGDDLILDAAGWDGVAILLRKAA